MRGKRRRWCRGGETIGEERTITREPPPRNLWRTFVIIMSGAPSHQEDGSMKQHAMVRVPPILDDVISIRLRWEP